MSGETDLQKLLASMEPILDEDPYGYATLPASIAGSDHPYAFATIQETEGMTIVARIGEFEQRGIVFEGPWAKISLTIHSSLAAVGLTAAVAAALGKANISANVVAGFYHDHFFVQWSRRQEAMTVLKLLKR